MNRSVTAALRRLAPAAAVALVAVALPAATTAVAAGTEPLLRLQSPGPQVVVRYAGEPLYAGSIGLYAVAGNQPIELRTRRLPHGPGATLTIKQPDGTFKALPAGLTKDVNRLSDFTLVTFTNAAGKVVLRRTVGFCPNNYAAARSRPDGPPTSPYPDQCGTHPFTVASVLGLQARWATPLFGFNWMAPEQESFDVPDGVYTVKAGITPAWRSALGLTLGQSRTESKITVRTDDSCCEGGAAQATAGGHHHHATTTGKLSPQTAAMETARQKALGHKNRAAAKPPVVTPPAQLRAAAAWTPRPDLRSLPAFQIGLSNADEEGRPTKRTNLDFGATVWNAGPSPLVVDGFRRTGTDLMDAYQYFFDTAGNQVGSAPAGTLEWDPRAGHEHWHFTAFATYRLLDADKKIAVRSGKEAFCLLPTDPVDLTAKGAAWKVASTDLNTACGDEGALSIREVLEAGHGDTYLQYLPGQSFDVTTVPNGTYWIEVRANPDNKLVESRSDNNTSLRKVIIGGTPGGKRTVKVPPHQGIAAP